MTNDAGVWRTTNLRGRQTAVAVGGLAIGAVLLLACRPGTWTGADAGNRQAGFVLGLLLAGIGLAVLVTDARQTIDVDPVAREVRVETRSRVRTGRRGIPFDDIDHVSVRTLAGRAGGTPSYVVAVHLRSGEQVALFAGFYEGQFSRAATEERHRRLEAYLG